MSAEVLRRAAALMRERAEAATPGPWEQVQHPRFGAQGAFRTPDGDINMSAFTEPYRNSETAEHIASWHPAVALTVASLLTSVADEAWCCDECKYAPESGNHLVEQAVDLARAYLGEQP